MSQRNPKPASAPTPCAIELVRALVAVQEEQKRAIADDLLASGFTRAELELQWDTAVAKGGSRCALLDHRGTRKLLTLYVPTGAGPATCHGGRDDLISSGSG
jgi:hypothetical protein